MTSSSRHLIHGSPRWNYNVQKYKDGQLFCERGLFSILFLACGRPDVTRRSLLATLDCVKKFAGEVELICIENGKNETNLAFFNDIPVERKVVISQDNYGINHGLNQAWAISRGEACMIHENDWEPHKIVDFFGIALDILNEKKDVGIIQLRSIWDNNEQWGRGKPEYWPWDLSEKTNLECNIKVWKEKTSKGHEYLISDFPNAFNNNPMIMRKQLYNECGPYPEPEVGTDPRHGETLYQEKVRSTGAIAAHINLDLYYHIGRVQTVCQ